MGDCFADLAVKDNVGLNLIQMLEKISFCTLCEDFPRLYSMKLFSKLKVFVFYTFKKCNAEFKVRLGSLKNELLFVVCKNEISLHFYKLF
jgi:hypothetical protein